MGESKSSIVDKSQKLTNKLKNKTHVSYMHMKTLGQEFSKHQNLNPQGCHCDRCSSIIKTWSEPVSEIDGLPLISRSRAAALADLGITTKKQLAELNEDDIDLSKYPQGLFYDGLIYLMKNYAKADLLGKPFVTGRHPFFKSQKNIYFFDAEYIPMCGSNPSKIFLLGLMDIHGIENQIFLESEDEEKNMLEQFRIWIINENPTLVAYSSSSADKPNLISAFKKFNIPTKEMKDSFFDIFYECLFTQTARRQFIFFPIVKNKDVFSSSLGLKRIVPAFGYAEKEQTKIKDGWDALSQYMTFIRTKNIQIREDLLEYNKSDLKQVKYLFDEIKKLTDKCEVHMGLNSYESNKGQISQKDSDVFGTTGGDLFTKSNQFEQHIKVLKRRIHLLEILQTSAEPIGILKLSKQTGYPPHQVRYSLNELKCAKIISDSTKGVTIISDARTFLAALKQNLDKLETQLKTSTGSG